MTDQVTHARVLERDLTYSIQRAEQLGLSTSVIDDLLAVKLRVARELRPSKAASVAAPREEALACQP